MSERPMTIKLGELRPPLFDIADFVDALNRRMVVMDAVARMRRRRKARQGR